MIVWMALKVGKLVLCCEGCSDGDSCVLSSAFGWST
jgi:hypothetical protein